MTGAGVDEAAATEAAVSLQDVLAGKDRRVGRQSAALSRFAMPLVSVSIVTPGPVKDTRAARRAMSVGRREFDAIADAENWPIPLREASWDRTGPEALYAVEADGIAVKRHLVELENSHPLGRLWDFDVITPHDGGLSRRDLGYPARRCLVCERPSHECGRSRRHPLAELNQAITALMDDHALLAAA